MKIPAVRLSFRAGLVEIPTHGVASQRYGWPPYCCTLECRRIRTVNRRWWSFQNLRWSQVLTSVHNRISPKLSFRYDKWLSLRNEYDLPFEMRICTCVIKPFGSLQVVIRFSEWQAAGSRIRQAWAYESRCQNCPFDMINDCHFEMIYDSLFESRAVSIGRSQIETARRRGRRAVISRA